MSGNFIGIGGSATPGTADSQRYGSLVPGHAAKV